MQDPNYAGSPGGSVGKSSIGLDGNLAAALGYIIQLLALVLIFIEKDNRFVRFHAIQAVLYGVLLGVSFFVVWLVSMILGFVALAISETLGTIVWLLIVLIFVGLMLVTLAGAIFAAYKAYQGQTFKLPIVGNLAEKFTK